MPIQVNWKKFGSGIAKWLVGLAAVLGGFVLMIEGCRDVKESIEWVDEHGELVTDNEGSPVLLDKETGQ